jgi:hypothetical protein
MYATVLSGQKGQEFSPKNRNFGEKRDRKGGETGKSLHTDQMLILSVIP